MMAPQRLWLQLALCGFLAIGLGEGLKVFPLTLYGLVIGSLGMIGVGFSWRR